jgi:alpha-tubulin suppressor-like RCC1 family protein
MFVYLCTNIGFAHSSKKKNYNKFYQKKSRFIKFVRKIHKINKLEEDKKEKRINKICKRIEKRLSKNKKVPFYKKYFFKKYCNQLPTDTVSPNLVLLNDTIDAVNNNIIINIDDESAIDTSSIEVLINNNPISTFLYNTNDKSLTITSTQTQSFSLGVKLQDEFGNTSYLAKYIIFNNNLTDTVGPLANFQYNKENTLLDIYLYDESDVLFNDTVISINGINYTSNSFTLIENKISINLSDKLVANSFNNIQIIARDSLNNQATTNLIIDNRQDSNESVSYNGVDQTGSDIGNVHTCKLLEGGKVKCWGYGALGYLGYGSTTTIGDNETPNNVGYVELGKPAIQVVDGDSHSCALLIDNSVKCWGANFFGTLGIGNTDKIGDDETLINATSITTAHGFKSISAGSFHTCGITNDNKVLCWGLGSFGRLGNGSSDTIGDNELASNIAPIGLSDGSDIIQVSLGISHSCLLNNQGKVKCFGRSTFGQTGLGYSDVLTNIEDTPYLPTTKIVTKVAAGGDHTCLLFNDKTISCFGKNDSGQLGYANTANSLFQETPIQIGEAVKDIQVSKGITCIITDSNKAKCFGSNTSGQLGIGSTNNIGDNETPLNSPYIELGEKIISIAASGNHACAITISSKVYCFGNGALGKLGYGNSNNIGDDELPLSVGPVNVDDTFTGISLSLKVTPLPQLGEVPLTVEFNTQLVVDNTSSVFTYHWNFGDGNTQIRTNDNAFNYIYNQKGTYIVSVKAIDQNGFEIESKSAISVTDQTIASQIQITTNNSIVDINSDVNFNASITQDYGQSINSFEWKINGVIQNQTNADTIFNFDSVGVYTIEVTGINNDGQKGESSFISIYVK